MMKKILSAGVAVLLFIIALIGVSCADDANPTPLPPPTGPMGPIVGQSLADNCPTPIACAATVPPATVTTLPTATATVGNIPAPQLQNPGFETRNGQHVRPVYGLPEINVVPGWNPYFCDQPYTAARCPTPDAWNPNPYTTYMKRPEFKPSNPDQDCNAANQYASRTHGGCQSQQSFEFYGVGRHGVYQTVIVTPGAQYEFSAYIQLWAAENAVGGCVRRDSRNACIERNADPYSSDIATADDKTAIAAHVGVDPTCGTNAFAPTVQWSADSAWAEGFYDKFGLAKIRFTALSNCVTVFAGGYNRYGKAHNDIYIDDAALVVVAGPVMTAVPTSTDGVTPTRAATPSRTPTLAVSTTIAPSLTLAPSLTPTATRTPIPGGTPTQLPTPTGATATPTLTPGPHPGEAAALVVRNPNNELVRVRDCKGMSENNPYLCPQALVIPKDPPPPSSCPAPFVRTADGQCLEKLYIHFGGAFQGYRVHFPKNNATEVWIAMQPDTITLTRWWAAACYASTPLLQVYFMGGFSPNDPNVLGTWADWYFYHPEKLPVPVSCHNPLA